MEDNVADVEFKQKESLTRHEAATRLSAIAKALNHGGHVEITMGSSTVKMHVPDHVRSEFEVEVEGNEIELELELKWSTASEADAAAAS
jgi:amphi-Trp domain-containing protein